MPPVLTNGDRKETVERVIKKLLRTAMCIHGYFNTLQAEIIFASPKIHNAVMSDLCPCFDDLNKLFKESALPYTARILANDDFNEHVLKPILIASDGVSDTSELFLRAYQLVKMFGDGRPMRKVTAKPNLQSTEISNDVLSELKVGKIAQTLLREALERGDASEEEVQLLQKKECSKKFFGIDFPLLVPADSEFNPVRYYTKTLEIRGQQYYLCSQWFETPANNDRPLLLQWLKEHCILKL